MGGCIPCRSYNAYARRGCAEARKLRHRRRSTTCMINSLTPAIRTFTIMHLMQRARSRAIPVSMFRSENACPWRSCPKNSWLRRQAGSRSCCSLLKHKETQRAIQISSAVGSASPAWNELPKEFVLSMGIYWSRVQGQELAGAVASMSHARKGPTQRLRRACWWQNGARPLERP
jgi:hypothetical protein